MWSSSRAALLGLAGIALAGCGFQPLYSEGSAASEISRAITVAPLEGRFGFILRERLRTRLGAPQAQRYVLNVETEIELDERAIRADATITRFTLDALARFAVTPIGADTPVYRGEVQAFTGYSAVASPFATRAAEDDAHRRLAEALADKIVLRLAATARDWAE